MIKKIFYSFVCFLHTALLLSAQTFTTQTVDCEKLKDDNLENMILLNGNFYFVSNYKPDFQIKFSVDGVKQSNSLYKFDKQFNLIKKVELFDGKKEAGPFETSLIRLGENIFILYYLCKDNHVSFNITQVNLNDLSLGTPKEIANYDMGKVGLFTIGNYYNRIDWSLSPDNSILFVYKKDRLLPTVNYYFVDKDMNITPELKQRLPGNIDKDKLFVALDNFKNIYFYYKYDAMDDWGISFIDKDNNLIQDKLDLKNNTAAKISRLNIGITSVPEKIFISGNVFSDLGFENIEYTNGSIGEFVNIRNIKSTKLKIIPVAANQEEWLTKSGTNVKMKGETLLMPKIFKYAEVFNKPFLLSYYFKTKSTHFSTNAYNSTTGQSKTTSSSTTEAILGPLVVKNLSSDNSEDVFFPRLLHTVLSRTSFYGSLEINSNALLRPLKEFIEPVVMPYKNKILVFYTQDVNLINVPESEKMRLKGAGDGKFIGLAVSIFDQQGNLLSSKEVSDSEGRKLLFSMIDCKIIDENTLLIPLATPRVNTAKLDNKYTKMFFVKISGD